MSHAGHDHAGGHGEWDELTAVPVRRRLGVVVAVLAAVALVGLFVWWPRGDPVVDRDALGFANRADATVTAAETGPCSYDPNEECRVVTFDVTSGDAAGTSGTIETALTGNTPASTLEAGDEILVDDAGSEVPAEARFSFADVERSTPLLVLVAVFAVAVVALGRTKGLLALAGIALTFAVLLGYVFPALLRGTTPIGVALTGATVIAFGTLYLAHGVNERTTVALLGTLASLLLTAGLATAFAGAAELTGLASEESLTLLAFAPELDFRGLLLAAVILGALGVLDDVTITQVAAVWELHRTDPDMGARPLYAVGIRIGRDHIASTVNTLVLAYAAAALPLLLLFTQSGLGLGDVLTSETVAVEVVQTLVGSIGLVASVPLTTALACWVVTRDEGDEEPWPEPAAGHPTAPPPPDPRLRPDRPDQSRRPGRPDQPGWPDPRGWPDQPRRRPRPDPSPRPDPRGWPPPRTRRDDGY